VASSPVLAALFRCNHCLPASATGAAPFDRIRQVAPMCQLSLQKKQFPFNTAKRYAGGVFIHAATINGMLHATRKRSLEVAPTDVVPFPS